MSELKPCAHCGGEVSLQLFNATNNLPFRIICKCGIEYRGVRGEAVEDGIAKWNRRSNDGN